MILFNYFIAFIKLVLFVINDAIYFFYKKLFKLLFFIFILISIITITYFKQIPSELKYTNVKIPKKTNFQNLKKILIQKNVINSEYTFKLFSIYFEYDKNIKPGEYSIPTNLNSFQLVKYLLKAEALQRKVTIIEGLQYKQIIPILASELDLNLELLNLLYKNEKLLKKYKINAENIEGYIFPQTYFMNWGLNEYEVIDFLIMQTIKNVEKYKSDIDKSKYSLHDYIILASIIDAESNFADEMPIVSSVYHNRLNKGWKLQADPTILFILGKPQRVLFRHLEINSPYNTYKYTGLPKGPINNPGIDAIKSAIYPAKTKYMYFTGTGDGKGKHLFARSLKEHNKNRSQLDKARKNK